MAKRLYIGNMSYDTTEDSLRSTFSQAGPVSSVTVMKDKMSGRPRGFAFVEMENDADAPKAVETLNGYELDGRKLVVNEARPMTTDRPPRRGGFGGGGFGGGGRDRKSVV